MPSRAMQLWMQHVVDVLHQRYLFWETGQHPLPGDPRLGTRSCSTVLRLRYRQYIHIGQEAPV